MSDNSLDSWLQARLKDRRAFGADEAKLPVAIWNVAGRRLEVYLSNEEHYYEWIDRYLGVLRSVKTNKLVGVVFTYLDEIDVAIQNLQPDLPEYKSFLIYRQVVQAYKSFVRNQVDVASLITLLHLLFNPKRPEVYDEIEKAGREAGLISLDNDRQGLLDHFTGIL